MKKLLWMIALAFLAATELLALDPGAKAPKLSVKEWVKNGPVKIADGKGKNVYVIEFWATWCPPCRMSIPHLSKLQKEYKDKGLVVVAISTEDLETVKKFVSQQKDMDYSVGVDNNEETTKAYMEGVSGIPTAFVVNKKGIVIWRGHPMNLDTILPKVFSGKFDLSANQKLFKLQAQLKLAMQQRNVADLTRLSEAILDIDPADQTALQIRMALFMQQGKAEELVFFLNKQIKKNPDNQQLYFTKLNLLMEIKPELVAKCAEEIIKAFGQNSKTLNRLAWTLVDTGKFTNQPLGVALKAAEKAVELAQKNDKRELAANLDTLARCYYAVGRLDKALKTQERSVKVASGTGEEVILEKTLEFYRKIAAIAKKL